MRTAVFAIALLGTACGPGARSPSTSLPPYEGEQLNLFDDQIDPAAVGLSLATTGPAQDPLLRSRATEADVVARMRVQTVIYDAVGAKSQYQISVQVGVPTLMPSEDHAASYDLVVERNTPSFGMVQSLENRLRGRTFIGFIRRFEGDDGPEIHWHLTADTAEVAEVIQEIALLEQVAGEELQ